jgi:hypothetical protein
MSASDLIKAASTAAHDAVSNSTSGRALRTHTRDFVDALARVPDYPAAEFSALEIAQLSSTAEHVIGAIERRIDADEERDSNKQELADTIYEVRRRLEEISRWRRHYLQSATS